MEAALDETRAVFFFAIRYFSALLAPPAAQSRPFKGFVKVNPSRCRLGFQMFRDVECVK
jgi:hypothetical protein